MMTRKFCLALLLGLLGLAACSKGVPTVSDVDNIVVDGKKLTKQEFIDIYCAGQTGNTTCISVGNALSQEPAQSSPTP
jgi:hypothetical protein